MLKDGTQNVPASAANENTLFHVVPSRCTRTLGPCNKVAHKLTPCTHTHTHTGEVLCSKPQCAVPLYSLHLNMNLRTEFLFVLRNYTTNSSLFLTVKN